MGHEVIVLEKGPISIGVRTTPAPLPRWLFHLLTPRLKQSNMYRGIRMTPNMTKVFNYWGMRDRVGEISVVTDRVIMSRRTRSSPSRLFFPVTTLPYS